MHYSIAVYNCGVSWQWMLFTFTLVCCFVLALRSRYYKLWLQYVLVCIGVHWCMYCSSYEGMKYPMVCKVTFLIVIDCYD